MRKLLPFLTLLCVASFICAQGDSISTQKIKEVEVIAIAKPSTFQSGSLVQVQTEKDFERIGVQSVSDAVRRFAGVVVKDYGGIGGLKTVSIRGLGSQHTSVSYDGVTVGEAQSGQVDIGRFSLNNISYIALSIGQPDYIFQSARQFSAAGNLNIKTVTPQFEDKPYMGKVTVKGGSFGMFNPSVFYAHKVSDQWSVSASGDWQRADGTYRFDFDNGASIEKRKRYNSDVDIWHTELNIYGDLKQAGNLRLKAYYYDSERGLPAPLISVNEYAGERLWDKDFFAQGNYENKLSDKISIQGLSKFSRNYNKYAQKNNNIGENGLEADRYTQFEYYASASILYKPLDILSFSLAQDYFHNKLDVQINTYENGVSLTNINRGVNRNTWLTALNGQLKTSKLNITAGVLATHVRGHQDFGENPDDLTRISPSFNLSYKPFDLDLRFRSSYKDIFRVPSLNDIYYTPVGARNLKPEKAKQYNIGAVWGYSSDSFLDYLSISLDGYINKVKDKIVLFNSGQFYWGMVNMGKVTIKGVDLTINSNLSLSSKVKLLLNATYSYQDAQDDDTKVPPSYTPKHLGNMLLSVENPWINISYSFVASDKRYSRSIKQSRYRVDGFMDHTISVNRAFKWGNRYEVRLQGELLNLGNDNYEIIQSYPMPGRSFRLSGTFAF